MSNPLWGIDLGGTKIEGVILPSANDANPLLRTRIDTEAYKGYDHIVQQIKKLVGIMQSESGLTPGRIGFGTPGELDPRLQTMKNCNSTELNGQPLRKDLEAALQVPVVLANDANCFALAETHWGVVKQQVPDARVVFGIIMGTGVGGGIVINGQVWNGRHGIAGEWGHNYLDESGGPCYCGKVGCVEKVLAGPALQLYYKSLTGRSQTLKEIVAAFSRGDDPAARKTIDRLAYYFGKAVSVVTNLLDPDVIVVGGGVGNIDVIYKAGVESLKNHIFNNGVEVPVLRPALGDSAGVFGAAALVAG
ncbi:ROK family protein [Paraflavitalea sp. CAU 1676]|uniref:ROK family protein n=1 Tax=Paraflavitalea sp. CAU 1676 TaxID=3032598 RepID=UPI0023DCA3A4|nr:ROK family protein [Paraflavitalea sp. CAU 1676]MDF2191017.1 ROK family protein [Paraflavitalea sp. CAU 1676]